MTNKERYKQAFSAVRLPDDFKVETNVMKKTGVKRTFKRNVVAAAACAVLIFSSSAVYAANVGGIQRTIQIWVHGDQTDVVIQFDGKGNYDLEYTDEDGTTVNQSGGGVSITSDGTLSLVSDEELVEYLSAPDVEYEEDGSVWVYWMNQKIDITSLFEDGVCYVRLERDGETLYMTVKYQNGFSWSRDKYPNLRDFN